MSDDCSCGHCGADDAEKRCGRCKRMRYCNVDCQRSAWPSHKRSCRDLYGDLLATNNTLDVTGSVFVDCVRRKAMKNLGIDPDKLTKVPMYSVNEAMRLDEEQSGLPEESLVKIKRLVELVDKSGQPGTTDEDDAAAVQEISQILSSQTPGVTANVRVAYGEPLLNHAVMAASEAVIKVLLDSGADMQLEAPMDGNTVWEAARAFNEDVLPLLRRYGVEGQSSEERNKAVLKEFDAAIHAECNRILEAQEKYDAVCKKRDEFAASFNELPEASRKQIDALVALTEEVGCQGADDDAILEQFRAAFASGLQGVNPHARTKTGLSLLVMVLMSEDTGQLLKLMLDSGADPNTATSAIGETHWEVAEQSDEWIAKLKMYAEPP